MPRLNDNQKLGVIAGVSLLLAAGGGAGVYYSKGLVEEEDVAIGKMHDEIREANGKIAKIPDVEQAVVILRENLNEYVKILPEEKELNNFVRVANQFIAQSGVTMTSFQPGRDSAGSKGTGFARYTYKIELSATLWQFMQFMSLFEEYERFIQVKEFNLKSGGEREGGGVQDVVHQISMTLESYVYTGSAKGKDVNIPNYEHKVDHLREEIFEARQTITTAGYKFQGARGRRDIFVDPRETSMGALAGQNGPSPTEQKRIIDRMRQEVEECRQLHDRLQDRTLTIFERYGIERDLREKLGKIDQEISEIESKGTISHAPLKLSWTRDVVDPLDELRRSVLAVAANDHDRWLSEEQMRALLARMRDDLLVGDIQSAMDRYSAIKEKLDVAESDPRHAVRVGIESLYLRAKLAQEFSGLRLDISGILVNESGKSGVILNGVVYEEGEYIDNQLLVKQVGRDRIEFVYKGFTVVKTL